MSGKVIPVRVTYRRPGLSSEEPHINTDIPSNAYGSSLTQQPQHLKKLLIGESILHPINTKGLIRGYISIREEGQRLVTSLKRLHCLKSQFQTIIISIGINDSANSIDETRFEEKYDQLISIVKTGNAQGRLYICKIAPREDTDVTILNSCIERHSVFWQKHDVHCINNTHSQFKENNRLPIQRFFSKDGIHLTRSGVNHLLDAVNRNVNIVVDNNFSVFNGPKYHGYSGHRNGSRRFSHYSGRRNIY